MDNLYCSSCSQPCDAVLSEVGNVPECCGERGEFFVQDRDGQPWCPPDVETATGIFDPAGYDENDCAGCGSRFEEHYPPMVRPLTRHEEEELRRDLYAELEKSETPQQRAYRRSMSSS